MLAALLAMSLAGAGVRAQAPAQPGPAGASPEPGAAVAEVVLHREAGVTELRLVNGVTAFLRPMPGSEEVRLVALLAGGEMLEGEGQRGLSNAAASAWAQPELGPELAGALTITRSLVPEGLQLAIWSKPEAAGELARLSAGMFADPGLDGPRLSAWLEGSRRALRSPPKAAIQLGFAVAQLLAPRDDPRAARLSPAQIEAITPEAVARWLSTRARQDPLSVALVGDFELAEGARWIASAFGALPARPALSAESFRAERDPGPPLPPGPTRVSTPLDGAWPGTERFVLLGYRVPDYGQIAALRPLIAATPALRERVRAAVRERGLPIARLSLSLVPSRAYRGLGLLLIDAELPPELDESRVEPTARALAELVESIAQAGLPSDVLRAAREEAVATVTRNHATPLHWAALLPPLPLHGLSPADFAGAAGEYARLSPRAMNAELKQWVTPARRVDVIAQPGPR